MSINWRYAFNDSIKYRTYVSPANTSLRFFANYDVVKNFFLYTEVERAGLKVKVNDNSNQAWQNQLLCWDWKEDFRLELVFKRVTWRLERRSPTTIPDITS